MNYANSLVDQVFMPPILSVLCGSWYMTHCGCTTYLSVYNFNGYAVYAHTATQCGSTVLFTLILTLASNVHSIDTELTPWPML